MSPGSITFHAGLFPGVLVGGGGIDQLPGVTELRHPGFRTEDVRGAPFSHVFTSHPLDGTKQHVPPRAL